MNDQQTAVMRECGALSLRGEIAFPDVVRKLDEVGVERYHADLSRVEKTYYLLGGETLVESMGSLALPIGGSFEATFIESALRQIQRGEIDYVTFLRKIVSSGCVGYWVHITGRCALYLGRRGEVFREAFPPTP